VQKFPGFLLSWFSIQLHHRFPSGFAVHLVHPIFSIPEGQIKIGREGDGLRSLKMTNDGR